MLTSLFSLNSRRGALALLLVGAASLATATTLPVGAAAWAASDVKQDAKPESKAVDCDTTEVDGELLACAKKDLAAGQKHLDLLVKQTMESLPPQARPLFEQAHKAWLAYRDSDCPWNAYEIETGRTSELILMTCLADLTISRMEELEAGGGSQ